MPTSRRSFVMMIAATAIAAGCAPATPNTPHHAHQPSQQTPPKPAAPGSQPSRCGGVACCALLHPTGSRRVTGCCCLAGYIPRCCVGRVPAAVPGIVRRRLRRRAKPIWPG